MKTIGKVTDKIEAVNEKQNSCVTQRNCGYSYTAQVLRPQVQ